MFCLCVHFRVNNFSSHHISGYNQESNLYSEHTVLPDIFTSSKCQKDEGFVQVVSALYIASLTSVSIKNSYVHLQPT